MKAAALVGGPWPQRITTFALSGNLYATHHGSPSNPDSPPLLVAQSAVLKRRRHRPKDFAEASRLPSIHTAVEAASHGALHLRRAGQHAYHLGQSATARVTKEARASKPPCYGGRGRGGWGRFFYVCIPFFAEKSGTATAFRPRTLPVPARQVKAGPHDEERHISPA